MISAFLRVQRVNPSCVKITITDERVPASLADPTLPGIPPPAHQPKQLFSFYCDPEEVNLLMESCPPDFRAKVQTDGE